MTARRTPSRGAAVPVQVVVAVAAPCRRWRSALPDAARRAETAARAALSGAAPRRRRLREGVAEVSLVLADDAHVRALNRRWRGQDRATNVLSFPSAEARADGHPLLLGDVVLAFETVASEAAAQGKTLAAHLAHLVTHGVLHLVGFDHEEPGAAERMEGLERRVLAGLGVADPYRLPALEREGARG